MKTTVNAFSFFYVTEMDMRPTLIQHDRPEGKTWFDAMQAASDAYDATLAPVHTYFVRMAVKTSMYLLPDRATFIASIGETGALLITLLLPLLTCLFRCEVAE